MCRVERISHIGRDGEKPVEVQRSVADEVLQGLAFQILHDDEGHPIVFADVIDCADVGMVQGGCGLGLAECVSTDKTCPIRESNIERIRTMVRNASPL